MIYTEKLSVLSLVLLGVIGYLVHSWWMTPNNMMRDAIMMNLEGFIK